MSVAVAETYYEGSAQPPVAVRRKPDFIKPKGSKEEAQAQADARQLPFKAIWALPLPIDTQPHPIAKRIGQTLVADEIFQKLAEGLREDIGRALLDDERVGYEDWSDDAAHTIDLMLASVQGIDATSKEEVAYKRERVVKFAHPKPDSDVVITLGLIHKAVTRITVQLTKLNRLDLVERLNQLVSMIHGVVRSELKRAMQS